MNAMRIAKRDALVAMKQQYPELSLTPLRMSDHLIATVPPRRYLWARKLSDEQVLDIRRRWGAGHASSVELAKEHGIDPKAIYNIIDGMTYKELA